MKACSRAGDKRWHLPSLAYGVTMALKIAIQMDPFLKLNSSTDSSLRLALEAQRRGHTPCYYEVDDLIYSEGKLRALGRKLRFPDSDLQRIQTDVLGEIDLQTRDVILIRQDPPFDMSYITTTHLLDRLGPGTVIVNAPFWVRNYPEKLLVLDFPDLIPPTMIARNKKALADFRSRHEDIVLKPLYGNAGAGVFRVKPGDGNFNALCEMFFDNSREPVIVQKFLPAVAEGDKRIILVDGEPAGAINRIPPEDDNRSNLHVGGKAEHADLTPRDLEICKALGPRLRDHGQVFVGIDVIGGYLTEINLTSPTGLVQLQRLSGQNVAETIWEAIEKRVASQ